jgi:hypothetical protein
LRVWTVRQPASQSLAAATGTIIAREVEIAMLFYELVDLAGREGGSAVLKPPQHAPLLRVIPELLLEYPREHQVEPPMFSYTGEKGKREGELEPAAWSR